MYQIADELQLDIVIDMPFAEESTFINAKSEKKRLRVFKFLNTRWDHVEVKLNELTNLDEKEAIVVTRDQMMARHKSNHIQVVYAPNEKAAHKGARIKAAMLAEMGLRVQLCGEVHLK